MIYSLIMMLRDKKMKKDNHLNIYVTTEQGDQHLFETWEMVPSSDNMKEWNKLKKKDFNSFENKLKALSNPKNIVNLAV